MVASFMHNVYALYCIYVTVSVFIENCSTKASTSYSLLTLKQRQQNPAQGEDTTGNYCFSYLNKLGKVLQTLQKKGAILLIPQ